MPVISTWTGAELAPPVKLIWLTNTFTPGIVSVSTLTFEPSSAVDNERLFFGQRETTISVSLSVLIPSLPLPTLVRMFVTSGRVEMIFSIFRLWRLLLSRVVPGAYSRATENWLRSVCFMNSNPVSPAAGIIRLMMRPEATTNSTL